MAALLLVANTIRLAAFARRREIGIMRLVGASTLYIALPFLMEALVTAVIGVALAAARCGAFMEFVVKKQLSGTQLHPVGRQERRLLGFDLDRDPRPGAHRDSDTRTDPQIPQSVSPVG